MRHRHAQRCCAGESARARGHSDRHCHLPARRGARHRGQPHRQQPRRAFSPPVRRPLPDARGRTRMAPGRGSRSNQDARRKSGRPHGVRVLRRASSRLPDRPARIEWLYHRRSRYSQEPTASIERVDRRNKPRFGVAPQASAPFRRSARPDEGQPPAFARICPHLRGLLPPQLSYSPNAPS